MKYLKILILSLCILPQLSNAQIMWQINKDTVISWHYNDGDEFNSNTLNIEKWKYWYGWSRSIYTQKEQQYYTEGLNHELKNGILNLYAKREKIEAKMVDWMADTVKLYNEGKSIGQNKRTFEYSAGMIQSLKYFKYGYFEIKFKTPEHNGFWPAFWLYGGTPNEEIDWMELKTEKKNAIHVGRHSQKREENKIRNIIRKKWWGDWVYFKGDLSKGWNIVSGEWTPEYLKYYLNGECIAYTKLSMNIEKVLCANIAVPSNDGSFHPGPDTNLINSGNFAIDYIRVWQHSTIDNIPSINENPISCEREIAKSQLTSKTKFLYGKKSIHTNEGIIVSLYKQADNIYSLTALGREVPTLSKLELINEQDQVVYKNNLKYGETEINLNNYEGKKFHIKISCYNKIIVHQLDKDFKTYR